MVTIAVCDDDEYMRKELQQKISHEMNGRHLEFSVQMFPSAESLLYRNTPFDIVFLDIQMDRMNGMEAARQIRERDGKCAIIFITVLKELVFESFEVGASDYLIKPIQGDRLSRTLDRIIRQMEDRDLKFLSVRRGQAYWQIKISDIYYCEVIKRKIYLHMRTEVLDYYESIESLERMLSSGFFRCHRSYLVNLNHVKGYENGRAVLSDGTTIPVSRLRQQEFSKAVLEYMKNRGRCDVRTTDQ